MKPDDTLQHELLTAWEETYKKGQLTLWIFLALKEGPKYVSELQESIRHFSIKTMGAAMKFSSKIIREQLHSRLSAQS